MVSVFEQRCIAAEEQERRDKESAKKAEQARAKKKTHLSTTAGTAQSSSLAAATAASASASASTPIAANPDRGAGGSNGNAADVESTGNYSTVVGKSRQKLGTATDTKSLDHDAVGQGGTDVPDRDTKNGAVSGNTNNNTANAIGTGKGSKGRVGSGGAQVGAGGAGGGWRGGVHGVASCSSESECLEAHIRGLRSGEDGEAL